jgi:hypothetical protein
MKTWNNILQSFEQGSTRMYKRRYGHSPVTRTLAMTYAYPMRHKTKGRRTIPRNFTKNNWKAYRNLRALGWNPKAAANFVSSVKAVTKK